MILVNPGGIRVTAQPVSFGATSPAEASFTVQSGGIAAQVGSTIGGSTLALTVKSVKANCSTTSPRSFITRAFNNSPVAVSAQKRWP